MDDEGLERWLSRSSVHFYGKTLIAWCIRLQSSQASWVFGPSTYQTWLSRSRFNEEQAEHKRVKVYSTKFYC